MASNLTHGPNLAPHRRRVDVRNRWIVRMVLVGCALALAAGFGQAQPTIHDGSLVDEPPPALVSVGVAAGFPAYQTVGASVAIQTGPIGAEVRAGYGGNAIGSIGAVLRGYPPLPGVAVPMWLGAGAMATGGALAPFVALGAHVPLAARVRLDVEGGAAWPRLGLERNLAPHLRVGVSYAFAVAAPEIREPPTSGASTVERPDAEGCEPGPLVTESLDDALRSAERRFLDDLRATYGSLYRDLDYRIEVVATTLVGDLATLDLAYRGSVTEIARGQRISASGEAEADFRWTGCGWRQTALRY